MDASLLSAIITEKKPCLGKKHAQIGIYYSHNNHGFMYARSVFRKGKGRNFIQCVNRCKRRGYSIYSVFFGNPAVFGVCPHYNVLLLCYGKNRAIIHSGICRTDFYIAFSFDFTADV